MNISNEQSVDTPDTHINPVEKDNEIMKTPEEAVKEPSEPVPAVDEINPPLEATLGGDDVVVASEKK